MIRDVDRTVAPWLVARARAEFARLDLGPLQDEPPYGDTDFAHVEHMLHEVAHALLLNMPLRAQLQRSIGAALLDLPDYEARWHEAHAWAVEFYAAQALGVPLDISEVYDGASVQGCFEYEVRDALEDPRSRELASKLAAFVQES